MKKFFAFIDDAPEWFFPIITAIGVLMLVLASFWPQPAEPVQEPTTNRSQLETEQFREATKMMPDTLSDWNKLIIAIALTESRLNPDAIGKAGDSGILQIRECYVAEVNRLYGTHYTIEDAFRPETAIELFLLLQEHYNPEKDLERAIYYHNKTRWYRRKVMENYELVERYESLRTMLNNN